MTNRNMEEMLMIMDPTYQVHLQKKATTIMVLIISKDYNSLLSNLTINNHTQTLFITSITLPLSPSRENQLEDFNCQSNSDIFNVFLPSD